MVVPPVVPEWSRDFHGKAADTVCFAAMLVSLLIIVLAVGCALALRTSALVEKVGCTGL